MYLVSMLHCMYVSLYQACIYDACIYDACHKWGQTESLFLGVGLHLLCLDGGMIIWWSYDVYVTKVAAQNISRYNFFVYMYNLVLAVPPYEVARGRWLHRPWRWARSRRWSSQWRKPCQASPAEHSWSWNRSFAMIFPMCIWCCWGSLIQAKISNSLCDFNRTASWF